MSMGLKEDIEKVISKIRPMLQADGGVERYLNEKMDGIKSVEVV